ncbi:MAG: multicopper oxidase family protein [Euryarchaeota archaeon]|nr:multicopper oxidase family protein [Euryarchaeota archaeon]
MSSIASRPTQIGFVFILLLASLSGCVGTSPAPSEGAPVQFASSGEVKEFDLFVHHGIIQLFPGATVQAMFFTDKETAPAPGEVVHSGHGTVPGPMIRVREGDLVRVNVRNLAAPFNHTFHVHGLIVPWEQDGVPYLTQAPIKPGEAYTYEFTLKQSGTYWYHCHVDAAHHIDMGMYGAFIVEPADNSKEPKFNREETLIFDEWDTSHIHNLAVGQNAIPKSGDPLAVGDYATRQARDGYNNQQVAANPVREPRNWYPETYPPYMPQYNAFLINGKAFPETETISVETGDTLRLRLINAGFEWHAIHLHGHNFLVTHKDGYLLSAPYRADTISIGPGERYDIVVELNNPGIWMLQDANELSLRNDQIYPGGMMTSIVYKSYADKAGVHSHRAADYLNLYERLNA